MSRESTAYHEAGHAVVAYALGVRGVWATIDPDTATRVYQRGEAVGLMWADEWGDTGHDEDAAINVAGRIAEGLAGHQRDISGGDLSNVVENIRKGADCGKACKRARDILTRHWPAVEVLADWMLKYDHITPQVVESAIRQAPRGRVRIEVPVTQGGASYAQ